MGRGACKVGHGQSDKGGTGDIMPKPHCHQVLALKGLRTKVKRNAACPPHVHARVCVLGGLADPCGLPPTRSNRQIVDADDIGHLTLVLRAQNIGHLCHRP